MSVEWTLEELGKIVTGKTPPKAIQNAYSHVGMPFITPKDMDGRKWILTTERYLSDEGISSVQRYIVPAGSIAVSCIGSDMGKAARIAVDSVTNQQINTLIPDTDKCEPDYLYYLLSTMQQNLKNISGGSATPILNKGHFGKVKVTLPNVRYQSKAAKILATLDDKIQLNHQINQTLEQMAQAIFKSWFVDFEPVRAKMEAKKRWHALQPGNEPASPVCYAGEPQPLPDLETYMNLAAMQAISGKDADQLTRMQAEQPEQYAELQTTAALFPAAMQASELGEIPEGWEVGSFQDLCIKVESGGTPKRKSPEYWGGNIKWLSSGEVRDVIAFDTREKITDIGLKNSAAKLWPKYTTVVAMYGATAGQVCFLAEEMTSNQACCGLIPKKNHSIFTFVAAKRSVQSLADKASGSAQQNLNKGLVAGHSTLLPPEEVLAAYEAVAFPFMLKWIENYREASLLGALRDTLLPKLLSGELSLPDAETELQEAAHA